MRALSVLVKPASGNCNMRCRYCFYEDVTSARDVKNRGIMSDETLEILVKKALAEASGLCSFGFQGGEPMLAGLDFFKKLILLQKKYNMNKAAIQNSIQTNGTLIDQKWASFFTENHFLVGVSVDGGKKNHDELRVDVAQKGTFNRCMRAIEMLASAKTEFNILTVVTKQFAAHPDKAYSFYKKHNLRYIQFIPCLDGLHATHGSNTYSLEAKTFGRFLCRIFDLWYDDLIKGEYFSIRSFDNYVRMLMGESPENCAMMGHCRPYPVIEADGSVYPCDFYVLDEYKLGDIRTDSFEAMLASPVARSFSEPSMLVHENCKACEFGAICRGGCRRDRNQVEGKVPMLNVYCEAYKMFFTHALSRMSDIARRMRRG